MDIIKDKLAITKKTGKKKPLRKSKSSSNALASAIKLAAPAKPEAVVSKNIETTAKGTTGNIQILVKRKFASLAQIGQSMQLRMAVLKRVPDQATTTYEQITPHFLCRDFAGDVYTASYQKHNFSIYGLSWDGTKESPDMDFLNLNLLFPSKAVKEVFLKNIRFLHEIEDRNNIPRTQYFDNGDANGIIIADKRWLNNVLHVSLYTFIVRALCYTITKADWIKDIADGSSSDSAYMKSIPRDLLDKVLGDLKLLETKEFCALQLKDGVGLVHHSAGFISTFGRHTEINYGVVKVNPHYLELKERLGFKETRF